MNALRLLVGSAACLPEVIGEFYLLLLQEESLPDGTPMGIWIPILQQYTLKTMKTMFSQQKPRVILTIQAQEGTGPSEPASKNT